MRTTPLVVEYERKYREDALSLLYYSSQTHIHLDWYRIGTWLDLGSAWVQVAYYNYDLVGIMGVSAPLNQAAWIRLVGIADGYNPAFVLPLLWDGLLPHIKETDTQTITILVVNTWILEFLPLLEFEYVEDVVTLQRPRRDLPELPAHHLRLRNGYIEDLHDIEKVDHAAFAPPWQMTDTDLRYAQRQAASSTVALYKDQIIGYELSTRYHTSGHLARLAVMPDMQGKKVGAALLDHLLTKFTRRGVRSLTVNTQQSNKPSQKLYIRYGFRRNGFDLPVWNYHI